MSLQTVKDLSRLRKKRLLWPLLYTASMLADHSSLLSATPSGICRSEQSLSPLHQCRLTGMSFRSPEVHHQLFDFGSVQEQTVIFSPAIEGLHKVPVLLLLSTAHTCHNSRIIRILCGRTPSCTWSPMYTGWKEKEQKQYPVEPQYCIPVFQKHISPSWHTVVWQSDSL